MRMQLLDRVKKNEKAYYNLLHYVRGYEKCRKGYFGTSNVCLFPNATVEESVHDHSEHLHLDMMIFPYSIYDGKAYHISKKSLYKIGMDIQKYLLKYVPQENMSQIQPVYGRT